MLVDLPTPKDTEGYKFWTEGTSLYGKLDIEKCRWEGITEKQIEELSKIHMWTHLEKGVYGGHNMANYDIFFDNIKLKDYDFSWRKLKRDQAKAARESGNDVEADKLLEELFSEPPDYGRADSIEQILEHCKAYIERPESFILVVHHYNNTYEKSYKMGPYIGPKSEEGYEGPDEVICFSWIQVTNPDGTPYTNH